MNNLCSENEIRALLERYGFRFSKSMGQNFLIAPWVPKRMAGESLSDKNSFVLEIGPGIGCLTRELSAAAGSVAAVEMDRRLPALLDETLKGCSNVEIITGDILALDIKTLVGERTGILTPRVCANLPYNITTPILTALIGADCFETITVMVQREVAKRICTRPGSAECGAFTVYVNYFTEPEELFDVPPDCFMPRPKVTSTAIRLKTRKEPPVQVRSEKIFFDVVRASFAQRRKTLVNGLTSAYGNLIGKNDLISLVKSCGLDERVRGETLDLKAFALIADALAGEID